MHHFKRQEPLADNANSIIAGSSSFKYKSGLLDNATAEDGNAVWKNAQIIVPVNYISSFFRSLELPLINTKIYSQLNCTKNSVISNANANNNNTSFKITKTELYVPVVTLKTEDNNKLNKLLLESESGDSVVTSKSKNNKFKRTVYWNAYKSKIQAQAHNDNNYKKTLLDVAIPGVSRLFVAGFNYKDSLEANADGEDAAATNKNTHA